MSLVEQAIKEVMNDPEFCHRNCRSITPSVHEVLENNSKGQWQGKFCMQCGELKRKRFVKYKTKEAYQRIYEKDYSKKNFLG